MVETELMPYRRLTLIYALRIYFCHKYAPHSCFCLSSGLYNTYQWMCHHTEKTHFLRLKNLLICSKLTPSLELSLCAIFLNLSSSRIITHWTLESIQVSEKWDSSATLSSTPKFFISIKQQNLVMWNSLSRIICTDANVNKVNLPVPAYWCSEIANKYSQL